MENKVNSIALTIAILSTILIIAGLSGGPTVYPYALLATIGLIVFGVWFVKE